MRIGILAKEAALVSLVPGLFISLALSGNLFEPTATDLPRSVATGDFNSDGIADIAIAHARSDQISILLGNGSGGFVPADSSPITVATRPTDLAVAELDGMGGDDLIVVQNLAGTMSIFTSSPDPLDPFQVNFILDATFVLGISPVAVVMAHFNDDNGDGILDSSDDIDIAVTLAGQDEVIILQGLPMGDFNTENTFSTATSTGINNVSGAESIVAGDWNNDGITDLAVANTRDRNIALLIGNGNRTFQTPIPLPACSGCAVPNAIGIGDVDGDGFLDLAIPFSEGFCAGGIQDGEICSISSECSGGTCLKNACIGGTNDGGTCLDNTNCPGDLFAVPPILAGTCQPTDRIGLYRGDPTDTVDFFQNPVIIVLAPGDAPADAILLDLDGDLLARPDLAVVNSGSDTVSLFLNDGTGGFPVSPTVIIRPELNPREIQAPIALAGIEALPDGPPSDLFVIHFGSDNFSLLQNLSTPGNLSFSAAPPLSTLGLETPVDLVNGEFFSRFSEDLFGSWAGTGVNRGILMRGSGPGVLRKTGAFSVERCIGGSNDGLTCQTDLNCPGGTCLNETVLSPVPGVSLIGTAITGDFNRDLLADIAIAVRDESSLEPGILVFLRSFGTDSDGILRIFLKKEEFISTGLPSEEIPLVLAAADLTPRDNDFDGIPDGIDNCPTIFNPVSDCDGMPATPDIQCDTTSDGIGDACEDTADPNPCGGAGANADCDNDGINNSADNCPAVSNLIQADFDADGIGDLCEREGVLDLIAVSDADGDGNAEIHIFPGRGNGTFCHGFSVPGCPPIVPTIFPQVPKHLIISEINVFDGDQDGVLDFLDNCPTTFNPVSDCDGMPATPDEQCDADSDGMGDACEDFADPNPCGGLGVDTDCDNDGFNNSMDNCPSVSNPIQEDSDADGIGDLCGRQGLDLLLATPTGLTLFTGNGRGEILSPTDVTPSSIVGPVSFSFLATGTFEGLAGSGIIAVDDFAPPHKVRLFLSDLAGKLAEIDSLDLSDPLVANPPIPQARFSDMLVVDLNKDGSQDVVLAETSLRVCASLCLGGVNDRLSCANDLGCPGGTCGNLNEGQTCDTDLQCDSIACVPSGAIVVAMGAKANLCLGGINDQAPCVNNSDCPGGPGIPAGTCGRPKLFLAPGFPILAGSGPVSLETIQFNDDDGNGQVTANDDVDIAVTLAGSQNFLILRNLLANRADINGSGRVDGFDLSQLARDFGLVYDRTTDPIPPSDLNLDGEVEGLDLAILTALFGRTF